MVVACVHRIAPLKVETVSSQSERSLFGGSSSITQTVFNSHRTLPLHRPPPPPLPSLFFLSHAKWMGTLRRIPPPQPLLRPHARALGILRGGCSRRTKGDVSAAGEGSPRSAVSRDSFVLRQLGDRRRRRPSPGAQVFAGPFAASLPPTSTSQVCAPLLGPPCCAKPSARTLI